LELEEVSGVKLNADAEGVGNVTSPANGNVIEIDARDDGTVMVSRA